MERAHSSVELLRYAGSNDPIEEPGHQRKDSLPSANEARGEPDYLGRDSRLPANEGWSEQPLLNSGDIEMDEAPQHSHPSIRSPDIEARATARQDPGDTRRTIVDSPAVQSKKRFLTVLGRIEIKWKQFSHYVSRVGQKSWTTETCSYFIAILALAGLVATLSSHQSKPLPQWPQLVTINSIISLFSLIMRTCVGVVLAEGISQCKWNWYRKEKKLEHIERLDSASRGSWGSFALLYNLRPRQAYYLAAMGAILTLMASLIGFFAQQLVQFQDCLEIDTAALVNISRTNTYSRTGGAIQLNSPVDYAPMVAAINIGILQSPGDLTSALSSGCNTGNCTFSDNGSPSFSTLAISHSCEDITTQIYVVNETKPTHNDQHTRVFLGLDYGPNQTFEWSKERGGPVVNSWVAFSSNTSDLIEVYLLFRTHWNDTDWKVSKCSLFPTINTYAASIKNAVLEESPISVVTLERPHLQFKEPTIYDHDFDNLIFFWGHRMTTSYAIRNGVRESCEGSDTPAPGLTQFLKLSDDATYVNLTGHTNPSVGWKWWYFPKDCHWSMGKSANSAMEATLTEVFDKQEAWMGIAGGVSGSPHLRVLFQDGNVTLKTVDERIKGLATAMTTVIRTNAIPARGEDGFVETEASENAIGTVWHNTTCIYIIWSWISFPSVMIGLTGLFLLLIAYENREIETDRLWKSSFLAALFCEVEVPEKPTGKEEIKAIAKSTSVSLEDKRATLRFVSG